MKNLRKQALAFLCCAVFALGGFMVGISTVTEPVAAETYPHEQANIPSYLTDYADKNSATVGFANFGYELLAANQVLTLPELFLGANPAVVAISVETTGRNFFGQIITLPAAGSGFFISADGYIVTNDHVIANANRITVMKYDGTIHTARVIGRYPAGDLAVIKIDTYSPLPHLTFGDSGRVMVGEQVAAIGNPLGQLANSMTVGHIGGLDRELTVEGLALTLLQTDTAVNRGNSGGPLLNMQGQVIGVVTARAFGVDVEGLGFAIPSNIAAEIVGRLIAAGPAAPAVGNRGELGITAAEVISLPPGGNLAQGIQFRVVVMSVTTGSGADAAGIAVGDLILSVNGVTISSTVELTNAIAALSPGDTATLVIFRNGQELTKNVVLGE